MTSATRLEFAKSLAAQAGRMARRMRTPRVEGFAALKGAQDFVTQADEAVQAFLRSEIHRAFPQDGFLGEEAGETRTGEFTWIIDPIDGTSNYLCGLPEWGVSLACVHGGKTLLGVIALPNLQHLAWAEAGKGAFLDDESLANAAIPAASAPIAILGHSNRTELGAHFSLIEALAKNDYDYRRPGAASFGLVSVAAGWADLFYEAHLYCWDALAGMLIVEEAGGVCLPAAASNLIQSAGPVLAFGPTFRSGRTEVEAMLTALT